MKQVRPWTEHQQRCGEKWSETPCFADRANRISLSMGCVFHEVKGRLWDDHKALRLSGKNGLGENQVLKVNQFSFGHTSVVLIRHPRRMIGAVIGYASLDPMREV